MIFKHFKDNPFLFAFKLFFSSGYCFLLFFCYLFINFYLFILLFIYSCVLLQKLHFFLFILNIFVFILLFVTFDDTLKTFESNLFFLHFNITSIWFLLFVLFHLHFSILDYIFIVYYHMENLINYQFKLQIMFILYFSFASICFRLKKEEKTILFDHVLYQRGIVVFLKNVKLLYNIITNLYLLFFLLFFISVNMSIFGFSSPSSFLFIFYKLLRYLIFLNGFTLMFFTFIYWFKFFLLSRRLSNLVKKKYNNEKYNRNKIK